MIRKFPPDNPCGIMLEEVIHPKPIEQMEVKNESEHPPRIDHILYALNVQASHDFGVQEGNAGRMGW